MFHRVPRYMVHGLDDLEALLVDAGGEVVLVFDADNTLVPQGVALEAFRSGVTGAIHRFEAHPGVVRVIVLTNGPQRGVPSIIDRGNKPWTPRRRLGLESGHDAVWVVGDQVLTDGILAWRLGATFVHLAADVVDEAPRQAVMRRIGRALVSVLFEP